jgi:flagellin-like hook-associated protein FlgL
MSMVVQHNLIAINSNRQLAGTTSALSKSAEKLSSGYRINRAADDAAGLSISEKMRKQIRGLDQASTNAQDGVSAVQTAEGALTEVHSMLQRMNELATQAANGTNSESDRQSIQDEIEQLTTEIDRVSETTKFNETYLLKGNTEGTSSDVKLAAHDAGLAGKLTDNGDGTYTFKYDTELKNGDKVTIAGQDFTIGNTKNVSNYKSVADVGNTTLNVGDSVTVGDVTKTLTNDVSVTKLLNQTFAAGDILTTADGESYSYTTVNGALAWTDNATGATVDAGTIAAAKVAGSTYTNAADGIDHAVVASLESGQVSSLGLTNTKATTIAADTNDGNTAITIAKGSSITVSGKDIYAVDANYAGTAFASIKKDIMGAAANTAVTISDIEGNNSVTYTIVENTADEDEANNKLTRENIIAKIQEGNQVEYEDKGGTTVDATAAGVDPAAENTISITEAYKKMADELVAASSVGADTDKGASVVNKNDGSFVITQASVSVKDKLTFNLHVGSDADMTNKINVDVESMSAAGLGIQGLNVHDDTGVAATYAIDAIADAISKVSAQRSALGAVQNRLEHTISNLDNVVENTTSAESRIRDTDMAEEMVEYSKNNILMQAGQAMLAQANQSTQGVLSLLQ